MMVRLGVVVVLAALASACGDSGSPQSTPAATPTADPEGTAAIQAVLDWQGEGDQAPSPGDEFDCTLHGGGPPPGFSVEGRCSWDSTPSADGHAVVYTEEWRCADFSGMGPGYENCTGEFGRYAVEYLVRQGDEVERIGSSGQLPPGAVE